MASVETMIPVVFSEGIRNDHLSLKQFVKLTSTNSARLFGLYPKWAPSPSAPIEQLGDRATDTSGSRPVLYQSGHACQADAPR